MKHCIALLIWVCLLSSQVGADTPLAPPADTTTTTGGVTVTAIYSSDTTRITAPGVDWTVPHWLRYVYPAPDGRAVIALTNSGNLIGSRDPDQIVLSLYRAGESEPLTATLSALMDPAEMPQTVSHYAWMDGLVWEDGGWTLGLTDKRTIRIDPATGIFTRQK